MGNISTQEFKNNQILTSKLTKLVLINLISVISLKSLNKYKDTDILDIVKNTTSKILNKGK